MSGSLKSTECRKFAPNIFNKSKCQNCFRTKDAHSAEALESNRATRKVSTCGYLFVAPDWDFSQAVNRTRRWQRRWFVLYDDGELTYSVDEHPNTIPQAVIDMTKVVKVASAEELTGNQFSIAITTLDKVHFVKGTGRDDSKWWFDVLSQFPGNMVRNKNKRNACSMPTSTAPSVTILACQAQYEEGGTGVEVQGYHNGTRDSQIGQRQPPLEQHTNGENGQDSHGHLAQNGTSVCRLDSTGGVSYGDVVDSGLVSRSRRYLKRESRGLKSQRSRSDGVAKMVPASRAADLLPAEWAGPEVRPPSPPPCTFLHNPVYLLLAEPPQRAPSSCSLVESDNGVSVAGQLLLGRWQADVEPVPVSSPNLVSHDVPDNWKQREKLRDMGDGGCARPHSPPCRDLPPWPVLSPKKQPPRGVPDGCGQGGAVFDAVGCDGGVTIEAPPEDLFVKKGWLMRLGANGEWSKHWFVLRNASLAHFGDPSAEDSGAPGATLDLRKVREVREVDLDRSYAFVVMLWEEDEVVLCAVTAGIRTNWVQAIRQAVLNRATCDQNAAADMAPSPSIAVATESGGTKSQGTQETSSSDDHSEYFSVVDEDEEDTLDSRTLPPSPPLNRTAISRVKERARSRSNSRSRQSRRLRSPQPTQEQELPGSPNEPEEAALSDRSGSWDHTLRTEVAAPQNKEETKAESSARPEVVTKRPPVSRSSRRSSSLRELRTKKLESRCSELEEQLRQRDRELGHLKSPGGSPWALRALPGGDQLQQSAEALEAFLAGSLEKLSELKERLRKVSEGNPERTGELWRLCGELEELLCENEKKAGDMTRALRRPEPDCLQGRLARAMEEAWALKRELRRSQDAFDDLELRCLTLERDSRGAEEMHASQLALMTARIDDLTAKLALSEKAQRQLRQRLARADSKQEKRRLSLRGKEAGSPSRELEAKLAQLEHKLALLEEALQGNEAASDASAPDEVVVVSNSTGRRSSLDSLSGDQGMLLRVQLMDQRLQSALENSDPPSRPRICLQTETPEGGGDLGWSSLSLATSVTDLRLPEHRDTPLPSSCQECLECLTTRLDTLLAWLHDALAALRESSGSLAGFPQSLLDHIRVPDPALKESPQASLAYSLLVLSQATSRLQAANASEDQQLRNLGVQLRRTALLLDGFEERLEAAACSPDVRLLSVNMADDCGKPASFLSMEENSADANVLAAELDSLLRHQESFASTADRFHRSRQALILRRLSECLDVHPTSDLEPDALQNVAEQEAVLNTITEAASMARFAVESQLRRSLLSPFGTAVPSAALLQRLEPVAEQEFLKVRSELRSLCLGELESYCSANLPHDVLDREIVPLVHDLTTAACTSAVLLVYSASLRERAEMVLEDMRKGEAAPQNANSSTIIPAAELVTLARVAADDTPSVLDSWLTQCLADDTKQARATPVTRTTDVAEALERLSLRLQQEKEGQRQRVLALQERLDAAQRDCERLLKAGCATCRGLREQARALAQRTAELERAAREGTLCERCPTHQEQLQLMEEERRREASGSEAARGELQGRLRRQEANHQRAIQSLEAELQSARHQLQRLQAEQDERIGSLRELYQQKLAQGQEAVDEEAVRQRCRPEMDQLKRLCEKGLAALEASHARLVSQLQERHRAELERVRADRDRALAEETQATLAALNAMQRAHQEELHREISSFKEDFALRRKHGREAESLQREHQEELEQIKSEILSLSEQYSLKCLEKASLEERLHLAGQQLQEANYQVLDLLARNKQLAAHLSMQVVQQEQAAATSSSQEALQKLLQLRDSQLTQQREENAQVLHCLQLAKTKIGQLSSQCQQLGNSLRAERSSHHLESQHLQARLEGLAAAGPATVQEVTQSPAHGSQSLGRPIPERRSSLSVRKPAMSSAAKETPLASSRASAAN